MPRNHKTNRQHKPSEISSAINNRYFDRSPAGVVKAGSNGHCSKSSIGAHWWMIESPSGPSSWGVCRHCKEKRKFYNSLEDCLLAKKSLSGLLELEELIESAELEGVLNSGH